MRGRMKRAWESLESWAAAEPTRSRRPMPALVRDALFVHLVLQGLGVSLDGYTERACRHIAAAVLIRAGHFALLRSGEVFALRKQDVGGRVTFALGRRRLGALLRVRKPKTATSFAARQYATVPKGGPGEWIVWLAEDLPRQARLFPGSRRELEKILNTALVEL